jgi:predicted Rossmann fold flavoprotein
MASIIIVGGGAAGMAAGIAASRTVPGTEILILEKNDRPGKKILATGNGRCNLSNQALDGDSDVLEFFQEAGIALRTDAQGRRYPYSERAADVAEALVRTLRARQVPLLAGHAVLDLQKTEKGFRVRTDAGAHECRSLLLATGGKAGPQYGCTGDGYAMARALGHRTSRIYPVLSPLESPDIPPALKGIRVQAKATLLRDGRPVAVEAGELQLTEGSVSGIMVMNLSCELLLPGVQPLREELDSYRLSIDLFPETTVGHLSGILEDRRNRNPEEPDSWLGTLVHPALARHLLGPASGGKPVRPGKPGDAQMQELASRLKNWTISISGVKGWRDAQCTGGGILAEEWDPMTCASRLVPGLYFAGEILGAAGPCGGYNLHHAWKTGLRAGTAMAHEQI